MVIVRSDKVTGFQSVVTCLLTSYDSQDMPTRVRIEPSTRTGLNKVSYAMTDKIVTVSRELLGKKIGVVES
ncbi:type II toxin-antitoxin system PemK/MazF family toxin [Bifidobacterium sp. ESL0745]|uniref:type II toxin-antitoxin system PemK/MazF family toxin n=1 Tax=Bifidobacterium sp. ESL0745 TaxID=2983226 RepID=UPI0032AFBAFF